MTFRVCDGDVPLVGDRASIVAFLRREYADGPWKGTTVFLILADAIEREVDREDLDWGPMSLESSRG